MNKKIIISAVTVFGLSFVACGGFNPNNRYVKFFNGQAYKIPYGVSYATSSGVLEVLREAGINCGDSDIVWMAGKVPETEPTQEEIREFYNQGRIGCSSPLSDQELQYTMHEENLAQQRSAQFDQNLQHMQMMNQQQQLEFQRQQQYQMNRFMYGY